LFVRQYRFVSYTRKIKERSREEALEVYSNRPEKSVNKEEKKEQHYTERGAWTETMSVGVRFVIFNNFIHSYSLIFVG
jgi:hypothetical protein